MTQYALFDTAIGFAGIAWADAGPADDGFEEGVLGHELNVRQIAAIGSRLSDIISRQYGRIGGGKLT